MPWVDDILDGLQVQIDKLWYDLLHLLAVAGWTLQKGLFMMGHAIELANLWLIDHAFAPLIAQTNSQMRVTASLAFVIALFVLGITYLLAAFVRLDVVSPRSAIGWYLAGIVFFQLGPALYQGMNSFRQDLSSGFYNVALDSMQSAGSPFGSLAAVTSSDLPPLPACDALGPYLPGATMTPFGYERRWAGHRAGVPAGGWAGRDGLPAAGADRLFPAARRAVRPRPACQLAVLPGLVLLHRPAARSSSAIR